MPIFDAHSLHQVVAATLAASDVGTDTNAFVAVVTRDELGQVRVAGALAAKVGDHWEVKAAVAMDHQRHIAGGVEVKATWS